MSGRDYDDNDYNDEEDDYDDENEDYHEAQREYDNLNQEWREEREGWDNGDKIGQLERMKIAAEQEREGREEAREWGNDDDGHEDRIDNVKGNERILSHSIAHYEGTYKYQTECMHDMDSNQQRELEAENTQEESDRRWREIHGEPSDEQENEASEDDSDMDICSDSDDD